MQPNPRHTTTSPEPPLFQPRRLVVGWDGSEDALAALDWAAGMGARSGLPLTVLTVGDPGPQLPWRDGASPTQVSDQLRDHGAQQALAEASAAAERLRGRHPELTVTPRGEVGSTAATLLEVVGDGEILVVGRGGAASSLSPVLGSVADEVVTHCRQPVVVVPSTTVQGSQLPVLLAVDQPCRRAAEASAFTASATGTSVDVVSVNDMVVAWPVTLVPTLPQRVIDLRTAAADEAATMVKDVAPELTTRAELVQGKPTQVLCDLAQKSSLMVVSSRGRGGFSGLLLGSTGRGVIRQSNVPVLVVRPDPA